MGKRVLKTIRPSGQDTPMAHGESVCWLVVCGRRDCSNNGKGQAALGRRGASKMVGTGARDESGSRFGSPHPGLRFHRGGQVGSALGDLPRAGPYLAHLPHQQRQRQQQRQTTHHSNHHRPARPPRPRGRPRLSGTRPRQRPPQPGPPPFCPGGPHAHARPGWIAPWAARRRLRRRTPRTRQRIPATG